MADAQWTSASRKLFWAGWVVSVLPALMLVMSAVMKFTRSAEVIEGFNKLGWDEKYAVGLGVVELVCTVIYLIPQTAVLGAILLTGYMGGAIATHVRLGEMFVTQAALGVALWLGLWLREGRLRALLPVRTP